MREWLLLLISDEYRYYYSFHSYEFKLQLPHLPEMVFHKNKLVLTHKSGATIEFNPIDALAKVQADKSMIRVACSAEWNQSRSTGESANFEEVKPFDWSFSTDYQGTFNEKIRYEDTDEKLDIFKLMQKERILYYTDLTLFEDELHDHGIAACSVKIVSLCSNNFWWSFEPDMTHWLNGLFNFQRVMPSGFFILLSYFLRVDGVLIRMNGTRFHYEKGKNYILKEYTSREAKFENIKHVSIKPNKIRSFSFRFF